MPRPSASAAAYHPPTTRGALLKLCIGVFGGAIALGAAAAANQEFLAWERGEQTTIPMPHQLVDLYELIGRAWTVAVLAFFGLAILLGGTVGWWRDRKALRDLG